LEVVFDSPEISAAIPSPKASPAFEMHRSVITRLAKSQCLFCWLKQFLLATKDMKIEDLVLQNHHNF